MDDWEDFAEMELDDDPEIDLEQMIDILIDHYGLRAEDTDANAETAGLRRTH